MLKYAILGFGGLGKVHFGNRKAIEERTGAELVAICDVEQSAFENNTSTNLGDDNSVLDLSGLNLYNDAVDMLEKEELDFIISALPTFIHEKYAVMAMEKGINVFSEKPMAINYEQGKNMLETARKNNVKLMIGQCVRYFGSYDYIKKLIDSKEYGKVIDAEFYRLGTAPRWSWHNWFMDESLSGGAALDLHVHDLDFINYAFGRPNAVCSIAANYVTKHDSIQTIYYYDDVTVTAKGAWGYAGTYPFHSEFRVRFEKATFELNSKGFLCYLDEGEPQKLGPFGVDGYVEEVVDFINCIENNTESKVNPPESSLQSIEIALAEKKSADLGEIVKL